MWSFKLSLAALRRHWLQSLLLLLGLALGTAVVVAVDLANQSAARSFELSREALSGKASHRIERPSGWVDESVYRHLRTGLGLTRSAPVLAGKVQVSQWQKRPFRLLGVDPLAEAPFRSHLGVGNQGEQMSALLMRDDTVLIPADLPLPPDRRLELRVGQRRVSVEVAGLMRSEDPLLAATMQGVIICDIGTAQKILNQPGKLSHIDLLLPPNADLSQIKAALPPGVDVLPARAADDALQQMSAAFSLNLSALSLLALVVGMFLVYNTVSFSVLRRRQQIGVLRALGVTRFEIWRMVLGETLILALLGSALGVGLGILLGQGLLQLVTRTINDLYYSLDLTRLDLQPLSLLKGVGGAFAAALLATLLPAWEATRTPPAGVLRASTLEDRLQPRLAQLALIGLALIVMGSVLALLQAPLWISFGCFILMVAGSALLIPWLARGSMNALAGRLNPLLRMAPRNLARSLSRSAVAIAALMVAVSVVISVSLMIGSFRQALLDWLDLGLEADLYAMQAQSQPLPARLAQAIAAEPGVKQVATARQLQLLHQGRILHLYAVSRDVTLNRRFVWHTGQKSDLWRRLEAGGVLVSQPYASHRGIRPEPGQSLTLPTDQGVKSFPILGIYYDYASDQGIVLLPQRLYHRHWADRDLSTLSIFAEPGQNLDLLRQKLLQKYGGTYQLEMQSQAGIKAAAVTVFENTFAITGALRLLAVIVAVIGIFSTLLSLLLERRRSFGILRAVGVTPLQLGSLILLESGLMGLFAGLMALPLGVILALFLIYVINLRSFGWTMELLLQPGIFAQGLLLALSAALLAGMGPAWQAARQQVARSVRWE